jgi:hypothetical protein
VIIPIIHLLKKILLGRKPTHSYEFRTLYFISLRWLVVEISRTEGWARKIQIRDRGVTRAIFIENGNNFSPPPALLSEPMTPFKKAAITHLKSFSVSMIHI